MSADLCRFSLTYPSWLVWQIIAVGLVLLFLGVWKLVTTGSSGTLKWLELHVANIHPLVLLLIGAALVTPGALLIAASSHEPLARLLGSKFHFLIDEEDLAVATDFNSKPFEEIVNSFSRTGFYAVRISQAAGTVRITGRYTSLCDADLVSRICHQESQKLTCDIDPSGKIIRICTKADQATCTARTL